MKVEKLYLKNFLIIEKAVIELSKGMTTVTGETGSGKSLFISAMKALKGQRINRDLVGRWNEFGEIAAEIIIEKDDKDLLQKCEEHSVFPEDDNRLVLKRIFGKKSGAYINDSPVSAALFGILFADHIEIGSQFENRELFRKDYRVSVLDVYMKNEKTLEKYREIYKKTKKLEEKIADLKLLDEPGKREYLEYQINEMEKLETFENEDKELSEKINFIDNRSKIMELSEELFSVLDSVCEKTDRASDIAEYLVTLTDINEISQRLKSTAIELSDIKRSFTIPGDDFNDCDPDELKKRFDRLSSILMKHSCSNSLELLEKLEKMQFELEDLNEVPHSISKLEEEHKQLSSHLHEAALDLREKRLKGAPDLEKKISGYLNKFGMTGVDLKVDIEKTETLGINGIDDVVFKIDTTGAMKHSDISTLSGGELSRLLLAVKLIDREKGKLLLFDEIDSSIGGETAKNAAKEMKLNSRSNQIVVVTHFPQTAASADEHLVVKKKVSGGKVTAEIVKLNNEEKKKELARMMGDSSSGMFNESASEMLKEA